MAFSNLIRSYLGNTNQLHVCYKGSWESTSTKHLKYEFSPQLEIEAVAKDRASSLVLAERTSPVKKVSVLTEDMTSIGKTW